MLKKISDLIKSSREMIALVWQSQPLSVFGLISIEIIQGLLPLATAWLTKIIFDLLAQTLQQNVITTIPEILVSTLILFTLLGIISQMIGPISTYLSLDLGRHLKLNVQLAIYKKINDLSGLMPFENPHFYNMIQLASQGALIGPQQVLSIFSGLIRSCITIAGFASILIAFSPTIAIVVLLAAIVRLVTEMKFGRKRYSLVYENSLIERRAHYFGQILSDGRFAKEVRLFGLVDYFLEAYCKIYNEINSSQRKLHLQEMRWQLGFNSISSLIASSIFVIVTVQTFNKQLTLGDVTFFINAVENVQKALLGIVYAVSNLHESTLFFIQYKNLLELQQPIRTVFQTRSVPPLISEIEFHNVSFRYSEEHPWVLRDLNLVIPSGKTVALVGLNGAGKTSLVKLLTRFYDPIDGYITWNGIDICEFDPQDLRYHLGVILQDFVHYDLTVNENIGFGNVQKMNDSLHIQKAASKAKLQKTVEDLPQGYQTILSRWLAEDGKGVDLSGGEWQKIALARMFMRDAELMILDEPTSALDVQAEHEIYNHFVDLVSGKTSLIISHRFSTVRMADLIAVLEEGKIAEYGSHDALMAKGGTYARLYNMQAERYR